MAIHGLYTGLSGIRAAQLGIDVAGNNLANVATDGYTRQRVDLVAAASWRHAVGPIGTGVDVAAISRLRDAAVDTRFRASSADAMNSSVLAAILGDLERAVGLGGEGLDAAFGMLWDAASDWANDPASLVARGGVLTAIDTAVSEFHAIATAWDRIGGEVVERQSDIIGEVDVLLDALVEVDSRVRRLGPEAPAELLDARERLIDDVVVMTGADARFDGAGHTHLSVDGQVLLAEGERGTLTLVGGDLTVTPPGGVSTVVIAGGEIGALHRLHSVVLPAQRASLNDLAQRLVDEVNAVNQAGVTMDGNAGEPVLAIADGANAAGSIMLTVAITDHHALAAAIAGNPPGAHDAGNAHRLAELAHLSFVDPTGPTIASSSHALVVDLGRAVANAAAQADRSHQIATSAAMARSAHHAVSIDEEMVDLVRFQRALEAASRVMTTVDQALDVLINRTGVVGR